MGAGQTETFDIQSRDTFLVSDYVKDTDGEKNVTYYYKREYCFKIELVLL